MEELPPRCVFGAYCRVDLVGLLNDFPAPKSKSLLVLLQNHLLLRESSAHKWDRKAIELLGLPRRLCPSHSATHRPEGWKAEGPHSLYRWATHFCLKTESIFDVAFFELYYTYADVFSLVLSWTQKKQKVFLYTSANMIRNCIVWTVSFLIQGDPVSQRIVWDQGCYVCWFGFNSDFFHFEKYVKLVQQCKFIDMWENILSH